MTKRTDFEDPPARRTARSCCARLAEDQHGVITRSQALQNGMSPRMIESNLRQRTWSLLYPNVYLTGGAPLTWHARICGAVLGGGPSTAASHRSAAHLLGLDGFEATIVEITSPKRVRWNGVVAHRGPPLVPRDVRRVKGIPTTTATHTLIGLGSVVDDDRLEGALDSALMSGLTSLPYLARRMEEISPRHRATASLRRFVELRLDGQAPTESELERFYHRAVTIPFALPTPVFQFEVSSLNKNRRIDFAYPDLLLGVEVLGWKVHGRHRAWQRDLRRHNELTNLGWELLYFPWIEVAKRPAQVAQQVQEAIERRSPTLLDK